MKPQEMRQAADFIQKIKAYIIDGDCSMRPGDPGVMEMKDQGWWTLSFPHGSMRRDVLNLIRASFADQFIIDHDLSMQPFVLPWEGLHIYTAYGAGLHREGREAKPDPTDCMLFYETPPIIREVVYKTHQVPRSPMDGLKAFRGDLLPH